MVRNYDKKPRFIYVDNLRSFVIILVILMHSAVTYSGIGGWYYKEGLQENLPIIEMALFGIMQSFTQAWFMGILFFISAFLAAKSFAKRGPGAFIKERLLRLGSTGPLWFVEALLLFCLLYTFIRFVFPKHKNNNTNWVETKKIAALILLAGILAFIVRLWFPIGSDVLNLQFSFFPSYIVLFILGIITGENNLFDYVSEEKNIRWFKRALIIGIPSWLLIMLFGGALKGEMFIYGGLYWQSFAYAVWEAFIAIGFSIGLIAFFKKYLNTDTPYTRLLAEKSFSIYVFHAPFLISVSLLLKNWTIDPLVKFLAAAFITFMACLVFSMVIHKIKPIRVVLK
ncbi:hypothetical protein AGMMS50230_05160 [Spirochaetia bacterium]|nr:hypothetical protein AGMMS50230_05160 [Spirochaetia bacterium]